MQAILLVKNKKEWLFLAGIFLAIFIANLSFQYSKYLDIKQDEIHTTTIKIINIYQKDGYDVLKLRNDNLLLFTSTSKNKFKQNDFISITFLTTKLDFIGYLKGFYTKSFGLYKLDNTNNTFLISSFYINEQHENKNIATLFDALFLAIPVTKDLQSIIASYGISHLIAISGFHLGVLSFVLYIIFNTFYKHIHQKYFPYRNKKFDLLIIISFVLFAYLVFLSNQASLLRAFVMYIFAIFLIRSNIKILSFWVLSLCTLLIISIFPKLLFSLSLWFSVCGVFYIFLFLQYFKHINKILLFVGLNFWLYFAINPISHYFFDTTSIEQLFSPVYTMLFSLFYPIELFLHIFNIGYIFDDYINMFLTHKIDILHVKTGIYFLIFYLITSILSVKYKSMFIILNIVIFLFNIYLFKSFISV